MSSSKSINLLKWCCFFIFISRGYQHLFWDAPYRAFLWDQELLEPVIKNLFNTEWREYVTNLTIDAYIQKVKLINGMFLVICAFACLFISKSANKVLKFIIYLGGINLVLLSLLLTKEKFYHLAMFFEHAIQFSCPFLLLYSLTKTDKKFTRLLEICTAITFICHGIYAVGIVYPVPANFTTMTLNILPISETTAKHFLVLMGILDFVAAALIFFRTTRKYALIYIIVWGILTALARIVSGLTYDFSLSIFHQYLYLTIFRLPHGLLPLILYVNSYSKSLKFKN